MEQNLDNLLKQLHRYVFAEADQVVNEIRSVIMDPSLKEKELSYVTPKIFDARESVLEFLRENATQKEALLSSVKKRLYELLMQFIEARKEEASSYIRQIKETAVRSFKIDPNSLVKEASLQTLLLLIKTYNAKEIETIIAPLNLIEQLLDEIKLRRPSATVKGVIWHLIGTLHEHYGLEDFRVESQDQMFLNIKEQAKSDKPELKAMQGLFLGLSASLKDECSLAEDQIDDLYMYVRACLTTQEGATTHGVMKCAMKLMTKNVKVFQKQVTAKALELVNLSLEKSVNENMEVREAAGDMTTAVMKAISENLQSDEAIHNRNFQNIMDKLTEMLDEPNQANILLVQVIKAVGIFSEAIVKFLGHKKLEELLGKLIDLSEQKLVKQFEEFENPNKNYQNFKTILKKQKQLLTFVESFATILAQLKTAPTENQMTHFFKICLIGVKNHRKLYKKYKARFYKALAQFCMSLSAHNEAYQKWVQKFAGTALVETLKIPPEALCGSESPYDSLVDAVSFWSEFISQEEVWGDIQSQQVYDIVLEQLLNNIDELNLGYKTEKEEGQAVVQYVAHCTQDQQFLVRVSNFLEIFLVKCRDALFLRWLPKFCTVAIKKASQAPRVSKLYCLLATAMRIASKNKYFDKLDKGDEQVNIFNMLLAFFKDLIGKQEEYQDELLASTLELLLQVPVSILFSKERRVDSVYYWKGIMQKSLQIGRGDLKLASTAITMLEEWFNQLPQALTHELYRDILPLFSEYLAADEQQATALQASLNDYADMMKSGEEDISKKDIALRVLALLGKIGGNAHAIINNEDSKFHDKENYIRWDPEQRLKFCIPLYSKKVDIHLDACLPKIVQLTQNTVDKESRVAACEFLHAIILYMIGTNAVNPDGRDIAPFAKIYKKLFPVVTKLATDNERISSQLFEPLCFQIVRWFASSRIHDHPEVESLLNALVEGSGSKNNQSLRDLCSSCVQEFAKWSVKQMTERKLKEDPANIRSLIRRVQSNSSHPDPFKRLGAVLCFSKIFLVVRDHDSLIDRFSMEIARCVIGTLKMCHGSLEFSQEVITGCEELLGLIQQVMEKKMVLLSKENKERSVDQQCATFLNFLFEKSLAVEAICRKQSSKLWEALVRALPGGTAMPDDPKRWLTKFYIPHRAQRTIFVRFQEITFEEKTSGSRKALLQQQKSNLDLLAAQLEGMTWMIKSKFLTFEELCHHVGKEKIVKNICAFFEKSVKPEWQKTIKKSVSEIQICQEDSEQVTKSRMVLFTSIFSFLVTIQDEEREEIENAIESILKFTFPELATQIILAPILHGLQLLVEDQDLERQLRNSSEQILKKHTDRNGQLKKIVEQKLITKVPMLDLSSLLPGEKLILTTKSLLQLCLGYLKLAQMDESLKDSLSQLDTLPKVVEHWLEKGSPSEHEASRILIKFLSKLGIPNAALAQWLTEKHFVYQRASDLILDYIIENWEHPDLRVAQYLVAKAQENPKLLSVFTPIIERARKKKSNFDEVLVRLIPQHWKPEAHKDLESVNHFLKIASMIVLHKDSCLERRPSHKESVQFIHHITEMSKLYILGEYSVTVKKEVMTLLGLIFNRKTNRRIVKDEVQNSLLALQKKHFPKNSHELKKNSTEYLNFQTLVFGFLDLISISGDLSALRFLHCVLREHDNILEAKVRPKLDEFIEGTICNWTREPFDKSVSSFFEQVFSQEEDQSIDNNLRWSLFHKVVLVILEKCDLRQLEGIMISQAQNLEAKLKEEEKEKEGLELYLLSREKICAFQAFEVMFRRLKPDSIRNVVHKALYENSTGKELTVALIKIAGAVKKNPCEKLLKLQIQCEQPRNSAKVINRKLTAHAYACLTAVIMSTQTQEKLFNNFLFSQSIDKGEQRLIDSIVDQDFEHVFEVETNFTVVQLQEIGEKLSNLDEAKEVRAANLIQNFISSSFMSATDRISQQMVFEQNVQELMQNEAEEVSKNKQEMELDFVNKQESMKNLKRCIDIMQSQFGETWDKEKLPAFMEYLHQEISRPQCSLNTKIFILKIVVNNPKVFEPFARFWLQPIGEYIILKPNGGKGFHYFTRDLCTLLASWTSFTPESSQETKLLCTRIANNLITKAADKVKLIFNTNIQILGSLFHRWKELIVIDKTRLAAMIGYKDDATDSMAWKMTGVQILALAAQFNIRVLDKPEENLGDNKGFNIGQNDKVFAALLRIFEQTKKQPISAAAEVVGKILKKHPELSKEVSAQLYKQLGQSKKHDIFVMSVERITREFPELLLDRKIFQELLGFVTRLSGSMRGSVFKSLDSYLFTCREQNKLNDINEIAEACQTVRQEILSDSSDENLQGFITLLTSISRLNVSAGEKLIKSVITRVFGIYSKLENDYIRGLFFELMVFLFDAYPVFKPKVQQALLRGLSDKSVTIRQKLIGFWSDQNRLSLDPVQRMKQIFQDLYDPNEEKQWLNNAVYLLLHVSSHSSDFQNLIFDKPLSECKFEPMEFKEQSYQINRSQPLTPLFTQASQMMFASQMGSSQIPETLQKSGGRSLETIPEEGKEEDNSLGKAQASSGSNPIQKPEKKFKDPPLKKQLQPFNPSQVGSDISASFMGSQKIMTDSQAFGQNQGFIRATQAPVFTASLKEKSALVASKFTDIEPSLAGQFYDINRVNEGGSPDAADFAHIEEDQVQDSLFIAPQVKKKKTRGISDFLKANQKLYKPMTAKDGMIRYQSSGETIQSETDRKKELQKLQREQLFQRQKEKRSQQVGLFRKYRLGELPDIQINHKDVLLPLLGLVKMDQYIATEMLIEIYISLHAEGWDEETKQEMQELVKKCMNKSKQYEYGAVSSWHRLALEMLKRDNARFDPQQVEITGAQSLSFQTSLILLEEQIIRESEDQAEEEQPQKRARVDGQVNIRKLLDSAFSSVTQSNRDSWFSLINLYDKVGNDDALKGIWSFVADENGAFLGPQSQQDSQEEASDNVNLIRLSQQFRRKGESSKALKVIESQLSSGKIDELDEMIQEQLGNQKMDLLAELGKWDEVSKELEPKFGDKQIYDFSLQDSEKYLKSCIRDNSKWELISTQVENWYTNENSKALLHRNFNYELSLISLTQRDYHRTSHFIEKEIDELLKAWLNLTKLSQVAQHMLVQKIQKIFEVKEFLKIIRQENTIAASDLAPQIVNQIKNWTQRLPSGAFDKLMVWDDILIARSLQLDVYDQKREFRQAIQRDSALKELKSQLFVQASKGAYMMQLYDASDRYLKQALKHRSDTVTSLNIVVPIIKLKSEQQLKQGILNLRYEDKVKKLNGILNVLDAKMQEHLKAKIDDPQTEVEAYILQHQLHKKMLEFLFDGLRNQEDPKVLKPQLKEFFAKSSESIQRVHEIVAGSDLEEIKKLNSRSNYKLATFSDKILRTLEEEEIQKIVAKSLQEAGLAPAQLAKMAIIHGFESLNEGYAKAADFIPRLLDIAAKWRQSVEKDFEKSSKQTPLWYFVRWIHQLVAVVNSDQAKFIEPKLIEIAKTYPQALFYPFKVIQSNLDVGVGEGGEETKKLYRKLNMYYKTFKNLNSWLEALDCLIYPEHRFKYWHQIVCDIIANKQSNEILCKVVKMALYDLVETDKEHVEEKIGSYNYRFAMNYKEWLEKYFGPGGSNVQAMETNRIKLILDKMNEKVNETVHDLGQGMERLSVYSQWLDELDCNDFFSEYEYIELPGQYEDLRSEPFLEKNIKIASVRKNLLILGSIRRPKRITVHGSNEKDYHLLVKGGEDLRLDQRIQQMFQISNKIFQENSACQNRNLYLKTFDVVPMTNRLGTFEWVSDTCPLKEIIEKEHKRMENGKVLAQSKALDQRRKWLKKIQKKPGVNNIAEQHLMLLNLPEKDVSPAFVEHKSLMPWNLLRQGLENLCISSAAFLTIKNQFVKSIAASSIVGYLLGIGDRHLENFLIDVSDGEALCIDFGVAFGSGLHLGIPELMPFRLTQQIEGVIAPHPLEGVYKQTMIHALQALKKRKALILDTCEIFVQEPLLDWVKEAKQKSAEMEQEGEDEEEEENWFPKRKIQTLRDKLEGKNPSKVLLEELKESRHSSRPYGKVLLEVIKGNEKSQRNAINRQRQDYLTVEEQLDCLIEMARDPNVLGRTWIGWSPHV